MVSFLDAPKKQKQAQVLEGILEQMEVGEGDEWTTANFLKLYFHFIYILQWSVPSTITLLHKNIASPQPNSTTLPARCSQFIHMENP